LVFVSETRQVLKICRVWLRVSTFFQSLSTHFCNPEGRGIFVRNSVIKIFNLCRATCEDPSFLGMTNWTDSDYKKKWNEKPDENVLMKMNALAPIEVEILLWNEMERKIGTDSGISSWKKYFNYRIWNHKIACKLLDLMRVIPLSKF